MLIVRIQTFEVVKFIQLLAILSLGSQDRETWISP